jgi:hypothetical protein
LNSHPDPSDPCARKDQGDILDALDALEAHTQWSDPADDHVMEDMLALISKIRAHMENY